MTTMEAPMQAIPFPINEKGALHSAPPPPSTKWRTSSAVDLNRENFLDLLAGRVPCIKIPEFLTKEVAGKVIDQLTPMFSPYLHATGPAVQKVGLAQFEFQAQSADDFKNRKGDEKQRYFQLARELSTLHSDLAAATGTNIWEAVISSLRPLVPEFDVEIAHQSPSQPYFSGIFRRIQGGTPPHCDWCPFDVPAEEDWILSNVTCQAVFNLYLTPVRGGSTTVYDVQWSPDALRYRDPETYGYFRELVEDRESCTWTPEVGQLCIFNSRNMHEVKPVEVKEGESREDTPRIACASFMGILPEEVTGGKPKLIFWS